MPVLDLRRNVYYISGMQFPRLLAPLLIVAPSCRTKQDLSTVVMNMPVFIIFYLLIDFVYYPQGI